MEKIIEMLEENLLVRYIVTGIMVALTILCGLVSIASFVLMFISNALWFIGAIVCGLVCGVAGGVIVYITEEI